METSNPIACSMAHSMRVLLCNNGSLQLVRKLICHLYRKNGSYSLKKTPDTGTDVYHWKKTPYNRLLDSSPYVIF